MQSRPYYEFGNVVQKISFKKTGNPENGLKKPVLTVYRQGKLLGEAYNLEASHGDLTAWTNMLARRTLHVYAGFDTVAFDFELAGKFIGRTPENEPMFQFDLDTRFDLDENHQP